MSIYIGMQRRRSTSQIVGIVALCLIVVFVLFVFGVLTALAPALVARLLPFFVPPLIVAVALSASSDAVPSERVSRAWVVLILAAFVLVPPYAVFKFGPLPAVDSRRVLAAIGVLWSIYLLFSIKGILKQTLFATYSTSVCVTVVMAYFCWRILSVFFGPSVIGGLIEIGWQFLYGPAMFVVVLVVCRNPRAAIYFMRGVMLLTIFAGLFAIGEKLLSRNLMADLFHKIPFVDPSVLAMQMPERIREGSFRSQATFDHPLTLAEFASVGACFGLATLLWPGVFRWRVVGFFAVLLGCVGSVASVSRSGVIVAAGALSLTFLIWLLRARKRGTGAQSFVRKFTLVSVLSVMAVVAIPVIASISHGKSLGERASTQGRVVMLKLGVPSVLNNPFVGTGIGSANQVAGIKTQFRATLDNHFLAVAIESGIPALLLFLASILLPCWLALNRLFMRNDPFSPFLAAGVGAGVVFTGMHAIMWLETNMTILYVTAALLVMCVSAKEDAGPRSGLCRV